MANGSYEEKSLSEDEDNANKALEDESSAVPTKKRHLSDSGLSTSLSHDALEDESSTAPTKKRHLSDSGLNTSLRHDVSEDDNSAAPVKKQCLSDRDSDGKLSLSDSDSDGFSNFDTKEEPKMKASSKNNSFKESAFYEELMFGCNTDAELLSWGRYSWRREDRLSRETYKLTWACEHPHKESKCIELLAEIGCEDRFLGCSIENPYAFYAQLNEKEVAMMEGLKEIHRTLPLRKCVFDV